MQPSCIGGNQRGNRKRHRGALAAKQREINDSSSAAARDGYQLSVSLSRHLGYIAALGISARHGQHQPAKESLGSMAQKKMAGMWKAAANGVMAASVSAGIMSGVIISMK